jgi:hypothetical protein
MSGSSEQFAEAMAILNGYYQSLVHRIAHEVVENRDAFESSYPGQAEEIIDRFGAHLHYVGLIHHTLGSFASMAASPQAPVQPSGIPVEDDTPLEAGMNVLANWQGFWFRARVIAIEGPDRIRVHYEGWEDRWDETMPRSKLQLLAGDG